MAEPPLGITIKHSLEASTVGIGVTCPITWSYSSRSKSGDINPTIQILEDRVQKFIICALVHLRWSQAHVAHAIKEILDYGGDKLLLNDTHMKQISDYIYDSAQESHRSGNELESIYWEAITRRDKNWCDWAKRDPHFTEASLADMPILVKKGQDHFHCGIPGYNPIRPQRLSWTDADKDLGGRPGLTSMDELEAKYPISVRKDSSGYTLYDITIRRGAKVRPELQKFLICTVFYHPRLWAERRAIAPAREFFRSVSAGSNLSMKTIYEILRYIELQVLKHMDPADPADMYTLTEREYWFHIMEYDYRWLDYGESWDARRGFTGNRPPVIDPPPMQTMPRYAQTGRPVLRDADGRIIQPPSTGTIKANHKTYFSAEYAKTWRQEHSSDPSMNPANCLPYAVVESGLSSKMMGDKASWPIPSGDVGKQLPAIATDGFLIADEVPEAAAESHKRARESSSATPGSTSSGDNRGRPQGGQKGQSSRSSSKADPRSQSSSGRTMTKAEGKQRESQRGKHR